MNSSVNNLEWRNTVLELSRKGHSQPEIARILQISQPTAKRYWLSERTGQRQQTVRGKTRRGDRKT